MANGWTILSVIAFLIGWAVVSGVFLGRAAVNVRRALDKATRRVETASDAAAFAAHYESIAQEVSNDTVLGPRWNEFDDSLLLPAPSARRRLIHSTARPDSWFDIGLLSFGRNGVDLRYHAALPNLLVGVGLFFTFLGLAVALSAAGNVVSGSAETRNAALKGLLDAASFKFLTSLAGLALSILYALFRKFELKKTEKAIYAFNAALEKRAPLVTQADLQRDANELLEKQATSLEGFSNDLAVNLGSALDRSFDIALERHLGPLAQALDKLSERLSSNNEEGMQRMLDSFLSRLQGGAGDRMQDVAESLSGLGRNLEGLQTGLGDAAVRMAQSADAMAARMGEGAEAALTRITDQMSGLTESLKAVADQTRSAGADAGRELAGRIESAAQGFEQSARTVGITLAGAAEQHEQRMGHQAETSAGRVEQQIEAIVAALRDVAENGRTVGSESFAALSAQVGQAATTFERTAQAISSSLGKAADDAGGAFGRGAEDAIQRIASATEGMRTEFTALAVDLRGASASAAEALRTGGAEGGAALRNSLTEAGGGVAAAMSAAAGQLTQAGDQAGASLRDSLTEAGGGVATAMNAAAGRLTEASDQAGAALRDSLTEAGSGVASALTAAAGRLTEAGNQAGAALARGGDQAAARVEGAAGQFGGRAEALAGAASSLAGRVTEFERAANEASAPLSSAAADLKAAGAAARDAIEPLNESALAIGRASDQVSGSLQRLRDAHDAAEELADGLTTASKRFEGVDTTLAETIRELQDGLTGFARQTIDINDRMEGALAKAVGQLEQSIRSLEGVLEEATPSGGGR